jgi:hypothetical protein
MDLVVALAAALWVGAGVLGGQLLSYPGDGLNERHFLGAMTGPVALLIVLIERARPD